ncbi:MAG: 3-oxoacyl-ACP reductase FabG [Oligosphaeraceae bacterium]|nr:3-oxoacyl-ACP reductase FabG [Oligosphaeraceae bacterium]
MKFDFTGQIAIVTGGTRGIGAAISTALLCAGAKVVATYANNQNAAEQFADSQGELAANLQLRRFDVGDFEQANAFFEDFDRQYAQLDILVNCAGIRQDAVLAMMPAQSWRRVLQVNLDGAFNMAKLSALRMLQKRYGRIIFLTSPMGRMGFAGQANYAASKAGILAMCKSLAKELAKRKITANCVSPGFIDTDFISDLSDEQHKAYKAMVPMGRFGQAEEVAAAVLYLASAQAAYVTGIELELSGGL